MLPDKDDTPNNPELKVDLDYVSADLATRFLKIKDKYKGTYSMHKHQIGKFTALR